MKSVEVMKQKLAGLQGSRTAKGEFFLEPALAAKITGILDPVMAKKEAVLQLGWDYVAETIDKQSGSEDPWGRLDMGQRGYARPVYSNIGELCEGLRFGKLSFNNLSFWKKNTDLFILALVDGPFQTLGSLLEYNQFMMDTRSKPDLMKKGAELVSMQIAKIVQEAIEAGADGIVLGEDIAYSKSLIVSPHTLREIFFPCIREIISRCPKPVVFHSDGNLKEVLVDIAATGAAGLHSLEEAASMNILEVRKLVGERICLFGGFDLGYLHDLNEEDLVKKVQEILLIGRQSEPYVFGTSAGILDEKLPLKKINQIYAAAANLPY
ncbi:MAG: uroporphyrinogen decarboxylase family protein [Bacillota bacterium]